MTYGEPTAAPDNATYTVLVNHNNVAQIDISTQLNPDATPQQRDEAVQALVDLLATDPAFTLVYARKSYPTEQEITTP